MWIELITKCDDLLTITIGNSLSPQARFTTNLTNAPCTHSAAFFFSLDYRSYRTVFSPVFVGILLTSYLPSSCETFLSPRAPSWLQSLSIALTSIHRQNFCCLSWLFFWFFAWLVETVDNGWSCCLPEFACKKNKQTQAGDWNLIVYQLVVSVCSPYLPLVIPQTSLLCQVSLTGSTNAKLRSYTYGLSCIVRNDTPILRQHLMAAFAFQMHV